MSSGMLSDAADGLTWHLAIGGVLILAMVVSGSILIPWLRRRLRGPGPGGEQAPGGGFTIERLEAMRRRGGISDEEFRVLRRSALGLDGVGGETHNSASSRPAEGDDDEGTVPTDGSCADRDTQEERG